MLIFFLYAVLTSFMAVLKGEFTQKMINFTFIWLKMLLMSPLFIVSYCCSCCSPGRSVPPESLYHSPTSSYPKTNVLPFFPSKFTCGGWMHKLVKHVCMFDLLDWILHCVPNTSYHTSIVKIRLSHIIVWWRSMLGTLAMARVPSMLAGIHCCSNESCDHFIRFSF
jgi:hypothetical protein